jgi:prephenate dehydrogenase
MHDKSYVVSGFKETATRLASSHPETFAKMSTESHDEMMKFSIYIENLENALAPYLNFHRRAA